MSTTQVSTIQDKLQHDLDIYSLYTSVLNNFIYLLQEGNNSYEHPQLYLDTLNRYIDSRDEYIVKEAGHKERNKRDIIIFILKTIYNEGNKYYTNVPVANIFKTIIIQNSLKILWDDNNIQYLLKKMNHCLKSLIDTNNVKKCHNLSCDIVVDYTEFTDINKDNIKQVYEKFTSQYQAYKMSVEWTKENRIDKKHIFANYLFMAIFDVHDEVDSYLFCLLNF